VGGAIHTLNEDTDPLKFIETGPRQVFLSDKAKEILKMSLELGIENRIIPSAQKNFMFIDAQNRIKPIQEQLPFTFEAIESIFQTDERAKELFSKDKELNIEKKYCI